MKINQDFTARTLSPQLLISKSHVELQALCLTGVLELLGSRGVGFSGLSGVLQGHLQHCLGSSSSKPSLPTHCNQAPSSAGRFHEQTAPFTLLAP